MFLLLNHNNNDDKIEQKYAVTMPETHFLESNQTVQYNLVCHNSKKVYNIVILVVDVINTIFHCLKYSQTIC